MELLQRILELPWVLLFLMVVLAGGAGAFLAVAAWKLFQLLRWLFWGRFRPGG